MKDIADKCDAALMGPEQAAASDGEKIVDTRGKVRA